MAKNILWIAIYNFINLLFVYKYASMFTRHNLIACFLYVVLVNLLFAYIYSGARAPREKPGTGWIHLLMVGTLIIVLFVVMKQLDPASIEVDRYPALHQWIDLLMKGEFPYRAESKPSAFPFLFLLSIPFYLLGDLGLLQITALIVFWAITRNEAVTAVSARSSGVFLLALSPAFLYELVVRSDLLANMILVIFFGILLDKTLKKKPNPISAFCLGALGGLVLSTRLIVLPVYLLFVSQNRMARGNILAWLVVGNVAGFAAVTVPFVWWDSTYFLGEGPFAIQSAYVSPWVLAIVVPLTLFLCTRVKSLSSAFASSAAILFLAVLLPFVEALIAIGWESVILDDRFDIAYFTFCLPCLILSLTLREHASPGGP